MSRKYYIYIICFLSLPAFLGNADVFDNTSPKERAKWRLANHSAAKRVFQNLKTLSKGRSVDRVMLIDLLAIKMRSDIKRHRLRSESRGHCREYVREARWDSLNAFLRDSMSFARQQTNLPVTKESVLGKRESAWRTQVEQSINQFLTVYFNELFESARERVVALQRQEISQRVQYPEEEELDTELSVLYQGRAKDKTPRLEWNDVEKLRTSIEEKNVREDLIVFEEVEYELNSLIEDMLHEIKTQYDQQYSILMQALDDEILPKYLITKKSIASYITESLEEHVQDKQKQKRKQTVRGSKTPAYSVFTIIRSQIDRIADSIERLKYKTFIRNKKVLPISTRKLEKIVRENSEEHKYKIESKEILEEYLQSFLRPALAVYYIQTSLAEGEGDSVVNSTYFEDMLESNPEVAKIYEEKILKELDRIFPRVRKKVVNEQYSTYFSPLSSGQIFEEEFIEKLFFDQERYVADTFDGAIFLLAENKNAWLADVPLTDLFEETEQKVVDSTKSQINEGFHAFATQAMLVREINEDRIQDLFYDINEKSYIEIWNQWYTDLEQRWTMQDKQEPYNQLFEWTEDMLRKNVRQLYSMKMRSKRPFLDFSGLVNFFKKSPQDGPQEEERFDLLNDELEMKLKKLQTYQNEN